MISRWNWRAHVDAHLNHPVNRRPFLAPEDDDAGSLVAAGSGASIGWIEMSRAAKPQRSGFSRGNTWARRAMDAVDEFGLVSGVGKERAPAATRSSP